MVLASYIKQYINVSKALYSPTKQQNPTQFRISGEDKVNSNPWKKLEKVYKETSTQMAKGATGAIGGKQDIRGV